MTLTIELSPEEEARLREAARRQGLDAAALARKLVTERLPVTDVSTGSAKELSPQERVRALLAQWQDQDNVPVPAAPEPLPGETPTQALFRKWDAEDAAMTDEERAAEDRLWSEVEPALSGRRAGLHLRRLDP